jgi:hypothetical protein
MMATGFNQATINNNNSENKMRVESGTASRLLIKKKLGN